MIVACAWCERPLYRSEAQVAKHAQSFCDDLCKNALHACEIRFRRRVKKLGQACQQCGSPIPDGRADKKWCKDACAAKGRHRRRPELRWQNHLKQYDLTPTEYDRMVEEQNGCCAICGSDKPKGKHGTKMAVDHCHDSGRVRGLLCGNCNLAIGLLGHDVDVLVRAVAYLGR